MYIRSRYIDLLHLSGVYLVFIFPFYPPKEVHFSDGDSVGQIQTVCSSVNNAEIPFNPHKPNEQYLVLSSFGFWKCRRIYTFSLFVSRAVRPLM